MRFQATFNNSYLFTGLSWNRDFEGQPIFGFGSTISFSYVDSLPSYYLDSPQPGDPSNAVAIAPSVPAILDLARVSWSSLAGITWVSAQGYVGDMAFGIADVPGDGGLAYFPDPNISAYWPYRSGDVWLDTSLNSYSELQVGGLGYSTLLHEIGHALGLDHTRQTEESAIHYPANAVPVPAEEDSVLYSTMSYNAYYERYNITPMVHDIVTIQRLYGANTTHNAGDTVYSFGDTWHPFAAITEGTYDNPGSVLMTLWDGGGNNDSLDASAMSTRLFIDLEPGSYSAIGTLGLGATAPANWEVEVGLNVGIAYGTFIENASGGASTDQIQGNDLANVLNGNGGDDYLYGLSGADVLWGGDDADTIYAGPDFDDLLGGAGGDRLLGGSGNDVLVGGLDTDELRGGDGWDLYFYSDGDGFDVIADSDQSGGVVYNNQLLMGGQKDESGYYLNNDGTVSYLWTAGELSVNGNIVIEGFRNGNLGIWLRKSNGELETDLDGDGIPDEADDDLDNDGLTDGPIADDLDGDGTPDGAGGVPTSEGSVSSVDTPFLDNSAAWSDGFDGAESATPPPCPLVLDLDGNGTASISIQNSAFFDHNANGFAEATGWVAPGDGLLVWDRDGDGWIESGREVFGNQTMLQSGQLAANGFAALAEWDANADGKINASDAVWANLRIWKDVAAGGFSTADELLALSDAGVVSIDLGYTNGSGLDGSGNTAWLTGSFTRADASTGQMTDYQFAWDSARSVAVEWLPVSAAIAALPDLRGFGTLYDLHQAMVRDGSGALQALVQSFVAETEPGMRGTQLRDILLKWTAAEGIDPASRGSNIDARELAVLERFIGRGFVGVDGSANPNSAAGAQLKSAYRNLSEQVYAQLMAQTHLSSLYDSVSYSWDEATQSLVGDLSAVRAQLEADLASSPDGGFVRAAEFIRTVRGLAVC